MPGVERSVEAQITKLLKLAEASNDPVAGAMAAAVLTLAEQANERDIRTARAFIDRYPGDIRQRTRLRQLREELEGLQGDTSQQQLLEDMIEDGQEHVVRDGRLFEVYRFDGRPVAVAQLQPDPTGLRSAVLDVLVEAEDPGLARREILAALRRAGFSTVTSNALGGLLHRMSKDGALVRDDRQRLRLPPISEEEIQVP